MEATTTPSPAVPAPPSPSAGPQAEATPIMDVVVQKAPAASEEKTAPVSNPAPADQTAPPEAVAKKPTPALKQSHASSAATKPPSSGVGLAISATVVIILGLAAMAVYAYLQTRK